MGFAILQFERDGGVGRQLVKVRTDTPVADTSRMTQTNSPCPQTSFAARMSEV